MLIGSRKFTEGWSSWRVSTMGLLNMGQGEGSQIIQLFGRGVRLKGKGFSLKRTLPQTDRACIWTSWSAEHLRRARQLHGRVQRLPARGGITPSDEVLELDFPTRANLPRQTQDLGAEGWLQGQPETRVQAHAIPWLYEIPVQFQGKIKPLMWRSICTRVSKRYRRIKAKGTEQHHQRSPSTGQAESGAVSAFNWDRIYLALQDYKLQRSWSNLRLERQKLIDFCAGAQDWYTLFIPAAELNVTTFADIRKQEDILLQLLTDSHRPLLQSAENRLRRPVLRHHPH